MFTLLSIALGGASGALARYGAIQLTTRLAPSAAFPYATLGVNLAGCFALGALHAYASSSGALSPAWRAGLMTGFLGAFTTYSTFANESFLLFVEGRRALALLDLALHLFGGLLCVALGHSIVARA
ncbi:MAG: fluoride efflux transporter CrcB [Planctomycetes bacterium]|nr:fluoride efflux transporter CrcB [Planctomycetota bacterium]